MATPSTATTSIHAPLGTGQFQVVVRGDAAIRRVVGIVIGAYVASRVLVVVCALVLAGRNHAGVASILSPWDGGFYVSIASFGYPSHVVLQLYGGSTLAFFPGLPLLGRALADVTRMPINWALISVTWVAGAVAAALGALLVAPRYGYRRAMQAGVLLAVFPGSLVAGLAYADALGVAFAAAALLAAQRRHVVLAGLLGAGATASLSLLAVPVVAALAVSGWIARRVLGLIAPLLAACGAAGYLGYLWAHTGSPFTWSRVQRVDWMVHPSLPWSGLTFFDHFAFSTWGVSLLTWASVAIAAAGLAALAFLRAPLSWAVLSVIVLAAVTLDGGASIEPRFVYDAFPLVLALGVALPRRAFWPVAVLSALTLGALLAAYSPPNFFLNV